MTQAHSNDQRIMLFSYGKSVGMESARSLKLLRQIEEVLSAIEQHKVTFSWMLENGETLLECLHDFRADTVIDAQGRFDRSMEKAQEHIVAYHKRVEAWHASACTDRNLRPADGVANAYGDLMNVLGSLVDVLQQLRDAVAEHDVEVGAQDRVEGAVFNNADDAVAFLDQL